MAGRGPQRLLLPAVMTGNRFPGPAGWAGKLRLRMQRMGTGAPEPDSATTPAAARDATGYGWDGVPAEVRQLFTSRIPHDEKLGFMRLAIAEARRSPFHPSVGAVIVRDGQVLARGFRDSVVVGAGSQRPRTRSRHAEEVALLNATGSLAGATLYTTLEPCFDRATPGFSALDSCSVRVARSGIRTVVVGLIDRDPRTAGRGAAYLAEQGVQLEFAYEGIENELYRLIGDGQFWHAVPRRPGIRSLLSTLARAARPP